MKVLCFNIANDGFGIMGFISNIIFGVMWLFFYFGIMGFGVMGFCVMGFVVVGCNQLHSLWQNVAKMWSCSVVASISTIFHLNIFQNWTLATFNDKNGSSYFHSNLYYYSHNLTCIQKCLYFKQLLHNIFVSNADISLKWGK